MRRTLLSLAFLACLSLGLAQDPIQLGVLAPLSGFAAADGQSVSAGIEIAVEEINAAGGLLGRPLEVVAYDDKADPKESVNFARRLLELDQVQLAVGASYSGATLAAAPMFEDAGVPFVAAYAVTPEITAGKPFVFRTGLLGPVQGRVGAVLAQDLGAGKVAVLTIQNDFGQALEAGFREQAEKLGLDIVFSDTYPLGNKNFTPLLARIRAAQPDVLYASGYYAEASTLVRQMAQVGLDVPLIGQEGYDSPKLMELGGDAAEGVYITTTLDRDSDNPATQAFLAAYQQQTGVAADMVGASGYTAVKLLARAVEDAGSLEGEAVRDAMAALSDIDLVIGHLVRFTPDGDPIKTATVQQVQGGEFHRYLSITDLDILTP